MAEHYEGLPPEIEKLSERLAKDPKSLVFSSLANAYRKHNMVDEAIEILQKGLDIHPNYASARIVLGKCYVDKRMYELAKEQFTKALESDPQNVVVLENLGYVYKTLNQYTEAFELFKRLLDLDPLNENFEREVEELKGLSKNVSTESGQYDTFQTIPSQTVLEEQVEEPPSEPEPEPESDAPTLSDIFKGAPDTPDAPPPQETTPLETPESETTIEKPNIITSTAADFSEMFEPKQPEESPPLETPPPASEHPSEEEPVEHTIPPEETTMEETPSAPIEESPPIIHGSPATDTMQTEPPPQPSFEKMMEESSQEEPPISEDAGMGGITSAFDNAGLETAPESSEEELKESLAPEPDTDAIVSELSDELSREEQPPEPSQETAPPAPGETVLETHPSPPQPEEEAPPIKPSQAEPQPAATETLAEIYLSQGFNDKALQIYKELLAKDPDNESIKQKVANLEQQMSAQSSPPPQTASEEPPGGEGTEPSDQERRTQSKNLDSFQDWLKKFQK